MYSEIPPLFMYTNEPVKLILKSCSGPRFTRSRAIFIYIFCSVYVCIRFRRAAILVSESFLILMDVIASSRM